MTSTSEKTLVGLDVGGTRVKAIALAHEKIFAQYEGPSNASKGPDAVRRACIETYRKLEIDPKQVASVGVGCAGSVEPETGVVRNSPNFANWKNIPLGPWLSQDLGLPITVDNDANCAVYCEWKMGNARNKNNVVLLTIGTGIGGGLILNGQLFRGSTGSGGELGHLSIYAGGVTCPCGNTGCFERYCSASSLRAKAGAFSAREIFSRANEKPFSNYIETFLNDFKIALTSISNTFDPDVILIGGGVAKGISKYFETLQSWLRDHAFPSVGAHVRLDITKYDNLSGALGAALLSAE